MKRVVVDHFGGPDVLRVVEDDVPQPGLGEVRVRVLAAGVSFTDVVNEHWNRVYRLLHCLTGNTHDTEDLTQETFLRALKRLDSFRPGTAMRAWLLRIATNAFFDARLAGVRIGSSTGDPFSVTRMS